MCLLIRLRLCGSVLHNLFCHLKEHLVNIASSLDRSLEEFQTVLLGQLLSSFRRDDSVWKICLVRHKHLGDTLRCVSLNLLQPVLNIVESGLFGAIIDKNDAHSTLIIGLSDSSEALLASCVPDLELDSLILYVDCFDLEVNA